MERYVLKNNAKSQLQGRWWLTVGALFVSQITSSIISGMLNLLWAGLSIIASFILFGIMYFGITSYSLNVAKNKNASFTDIFDGFKGKVVLKAIGLGLLIIIALIAVCFVVMIPSALIIGAITAESIFALADDPKLLIIVFLVLFLILMIPIIIIGILFSQSFFILVDNPELSPIDCLKESVAMMKGHKWECFVLGISFLGWWLLVFAIIVGTVAGSFCVTFYISHISGIIMMILGPVIIGSILLLFFKAYATITFANYYVALVSMNENINYEHENNDL